jgi:hypothetical protein
MRQLTGVIQVRGAVVDIHVELTRADVRKWRQKLLPIPPHQLVRALIDTGADSTCLDPAIISALALPAASGGLVNVPAAGGLIGSTYHRAKLTLPHLSGNRADDLVILDMLVCEVPLRIVGLDAVLGRDVLDLLRFTYDGPARTFVLDWS